MIEFNKSSSEINEYLHSIGSNTIRMDALEKTIKGITSLEEVVAIIN